MSARIQSKTTVLLVCFLYGNASYAVTESGWVFDQKSKITGRHQIYLSAHRIKAVNNASKISMYMQAPEWKIVIINDRAKTYCTTDITRFRGESSGLVFASHRDESSQGTWTNRGTSTILGKKVDILFMFRQNVRGPQNRGGRMFEVDNMAGVSNVTNWCMSEAKMSKQIAKFVSTVYCVSNRLKEFPLRVMDTDDEGSTIVSLQTTSIKSIPISDDLFVIPKGYKNVKTEALVNTDEQSKNSLRESFDWLGDVDKGEHRKDAR